MIPKIAHFHWDGPQISWIRLASMMTFVRANPTWELRLHRTLPHIKKANLPKYAQESDWTLAEVLYEFGGFSFGTDTVFVRPIPDEWLEKEFCGCLIEVPGNLQNNSLHHNSIGTAPGGRFITEYVNRCRAIKPELAMDYQAYGTLLLKDIVSLKTAFTKGKNFTKISVDAMTPISWSKPEVFWYGKALTIPDESVCFTWYGGSDVAIQNERKAELLDSPLVNFVLEILSDS